MLRENDKQLPWDLLTLAVVASSAVFQALQWPDLPRFMDAYYHLSVANGFATAGGYVPHAFWEYAPVGRPQLYPPLVHFIMLGLHNIGLSWISAGRLIECLLMPVFLLVLALTIRKLHSPGAAFFSTLVASSIFSLYLDVGILSPFTLALVLGLLALTAIQGERAIATAIMLGLAFYTHIYMATMMMFVVLVYGLLTPRIRTRAITACLMAIMIASPFLVYVVRNRGFYAHVAVRESRLLEVHPLVYVFAAIGLLVLLRRKGNWLAPVCIAIATIPLFFSHIVRSLGGHGLTGFIWLAGVGLHGACTMVGNAKYRQALLVAAVGAMCFFIAPVVHIDTGGRTIGVKLLDSTVTHFFLPDDLRTCRPKEALFYGDNLPEQYANIARIISANTRTNEIIWVDPASAYQGAILSLLTGRATSSATLREVRAYKTFDAQAVSRVLIWFKSSTEDVRTRALPVAANYNLRLIAETELAFIYLNPAHCPGVSTLDPLLPSLWIGVILLTLIILATLDVLQRRDSHRIDTGPHPQPSTRS